MTDTDAEAQAYAWNWFALHSGQRMQLVNFWLVAVAFLVAAFVQAVTGKLTAVAVGVGLAGVVASLAFMALDARTRRLVGVGEDALRILEDRRSAADGNVRICLVLSAESARTTRVASYRIIIQGLQLTVALLFATASVYTAILH